MFTPTAVDEELDVRSPPPLLLSLLVWCWCGAGVVCLCGGFDCAAATTAVAFV